METDKEYKSYPLDRTLQGSSAGGTYDELATDPLSAGELWAIESVSVTNDTNNATRFDVLVGPYNIERLIYSSGAMTAGVAARMTDGFYVRDNERVLVRIYGATAANLQRAILRGEARYKGCNAVPLEVNG